MLPNASALLPAAEDEDMNDMNAVQLAQSHIDKKRVRGACIPCQHGKRKCEMTRPCAGCVLRKIENLCVNYVVERACSFCKRRKMKCNKQRPCDKCVAAGHECSEKVDTGVAQNDSSDGSCSDTLLETPASTELESKKSVIQPWAAETTDPLGVVRKRVRSSFEPEFPMLFPERMQRSKMESNKNLVHGTDVDLPRSIYKVYSVWSLSEQYVKNLCKYSTPKLRSALLQLFGLADRASEIAAKRAGPAPSQEVRMELPKWESSRCGLFSFSMSIPQTVASVPILDSCIANNHWVDLAGIHKEEFFARAFAQDQAAFTSEFRILCRLLMRFQKLLSVQMGQESVEAFMEDEYFFGRISKSWGRGGEDGAVLTRMRLQKHRTGCGSGWSSWSTVVLTPEEYDTVAGRHPELCEALASEVLGPKTAAELLDPELDRRETLAHLSSTADGRAALDRLADAIHRRFAFFLSAMRAKLQAASASALAPSVPSLYVSANRDSSLASSPSASPLAPPQPARSHLQSSSPGDGE